MRYLIGRLRGKQRLLVIPLECDDSKQLLIVGVHNILSTFLYIETFSNEKFKRKDRQSSLFSFHFSINMNSSEVVISETPLPGTLPQNELLKKQLPTLLSATNQPIFASPQSPILECNLLQGGEIG